MLYIHGLEYSLTFDIFLWGGDKKTDMQLKESR